MQTAPAPSRELQGIPDLIDAIGLSWLARHFGHENASTVSGWKRRNSIPPEYWHVIIEAASLRNVNGVSNDLLARWHAENKGTLPKVAEEKQPEPVGED